MAPASGQHTRKRLRRHGEEVADYLIDAGKELVDKCEDLYERSGGGGRRMRPMSSPGSIEPCMSTAGNWWTRPKRSSAVRKALPSGGNREIDRRVPTRRSAGATPVFRPAECFRQPSFCC